MIRRLFTAASVVSLLLCVAVGAVWLSSYYAHERYIWHVGRDSWGLVNSDGCLQLKVVRNHQGFGFEEGFHFLGRASGWWEARWGIRGANLLGAGWYLGGNPFQGSWSVGPTPPPAYVWLYDAYYCCYWLPFVLTACLPAVWLVYILRHHGRRRAGHCAVCGYDLRASTGRCPECGTPIPATS